jgi:hypothetical protein
MSLKASAVLFLTTSLLVPFSSKTPAAQQTSSGQISRDERDKEWMREHYRSLRERLLPDRLQFESFPERARWVTVVVARDSFETSEYWFSLSMKYDGAVELTVKEPSHGSIVLQMQELRKERPSDSFETLANAVQIDERTISDKQMLGLRQLATEFESIRMSPVMPDSLMSDPYVYHFWSESLYGQEISLELIGSGPGAKQPHPLVQWAEHVRSAFKHFVAKH